MISRRTFLAETLVAALAATPFGPAHAHPVWTGSDGALVDAWLRRVQRLAVGLKRARTTPRDWHRRVPRITARVPVTDLRHAVDFDALSASLAGVASPEPQQWLPPVAIPGGDPPAFSLILAHLPAGTAVVPHGHHNMVSAHVVLDGTVRVRQYDRVRDEPAHLVLRPSVDRVDAPGDVSAISADRGNVHWFGGLTDAWLLVVATYGFDPAAAPTGRDYVDPLGATPLPHGRLRAPRLAEEEARRRYLRFVG